MERLLLPLLAALALPTAVNAESYWLILNYYSGMTKIPVESLEQCEEQGKIFRSRKRPQKHAMHYWCLKGK